MNLKEYIKSNKIPSEKMIAIYNKDNKWIICGLQTDERLVEYMDYEVISADLNSSKSVAVINTNYDKNMQLGYYRLVGDRNKNKK